MVLNLNMNMVSSVSIDNSGNVTMTPTMTASMKSMLPRQFSRPAEWRDGAHDRNRNGDEILRQFFHDVDDAESQNISVTTGSGPQFEAMGGMDGMSNGMIVVTREFNCLGARPTSKGTET
jgi:hypothetical protein